MKNIGFDIFFFFKQIQNFQLVSFAIVPLITYRIEDKRLLDFVGDGTIAVEFDVHLFPVLFVNIRAQLLQRRFLAVVQKLVGVRHVVDVNLHTRHDRRFLPEIVRAAALLYRELLIQDQVDEIRE